MFWIELKCDVRGRGCSSDKNEGPMEMSGNTSTLIEETVALLRVKASRLGWLANRREVICPACRETMNRPKR